MRVLTLTNTYPPHAYGGYELACRDVMLRFAEAGHDVTVLTSTVRVPGAGDVEEPTVHRELLAWWDWERDAPVHTSVLVRAAIERRNHRTLARILAATRPDVVSAWHLGGLSLGLLTAVRRAGVPIVLNMHNDWLTHGAAVDGWLRTFQEHARLARLVGAVTQLPTRPPQLEDLPMAFVSQRTLDRTRAHTGWPLRQAQVVPVGVDGRDFPLTTPGDRPFSGRLLYVGRIDVTKGIATLLRALPAGMHLEICGGGNVAYGEELRRLAADLGIADRVTFGQLPRAALRERYLAADLVVFPSEWDEPFGLVPLEAMACGTPVVASGTGGSAEFLVDGRNCVLFPAGDAEALRAAITRVASDPALRAAIRQGGTETARHLQIDTCAERLLALHVGAIAVGAGR